MHRFLLSRRAMRRRLLTAAAAWFVVAVAAFGVVVVALGVSGTGLFGSTGQLMAEAQAAALLDRLPKAAQQRPTTPAVDAAATLAIAAGTLRVTCVAGEPVLDYVSPAPGYGSAEKPAGPQLYIGMTGNGRTTMVTASCVSGKPEFDVR